MDVWIQKAVDLMKANVQRPLKLCDLAPSANLSVSRFSHSFELQPRRRALQRN